MALTFTYPFLIIYVSLIPIIFLLSIFWWFTPRGNCEITTSLMLKYLVSTKKFKKFKNSNTWRFSVFFMVYITSCTSIKRSYNTDRAENKQQNCDICFVYCISIWLRYNTSLKTIIFMREYISSKLCPSTLLYNTEKCQITKTMKFWTMKN